ncbi:FAD-dependent thymidylate synthase [Nocardia sp. IFM 10818]
MTAIQFTDRSTVELIKTDFADEWPVLAARTSTLGAKSTPEEREGLIDCLIRERHGVPFEHMHISYRVTTPIFVWRQIVKHRAGVSLSEESGRYRELEPEFYVLPPSRPVSQTGKPMAYQFEQGDDNQFMTACAAQASAGSFCWYLYENQLKMGIAREVARMVLPLNTMSTGILTFNARSLMHFLQLRTEAAGSHPQFEIARVAEQLAVHPASAAPITFESFIKHGSIAP